MGLNIEHNEVIITITLTYEVENGEDSKDGVDPDGVLQPGRLYTHDELPVN